MVRRFEFDFQGKKAAKKNLKKGLALGAFTGAAIGAISGILFAPKSGKETREILAKETIETSKIINDSAKEILSKTSEGIKEAKAIVEETTKTIMNKSKGCCCSNKEEAADEEAEETVEDAETKEVE